MTEQVLLTPPYSRNPYLGLIQQALTKTGLRVACEPLRLSWRMPPVIHVHWERYWTQRPRAWARWRASCGLLVALTWARLSGSRIIWTVHNLRDHDGAHRALERITQLAISRLAHALVVHHPKADMTVRKHLRLRQTKPIVVMPKGPMPVPCGDSQAEARRALGLPAESLIIAALGALRPYKRIPLLLDALVQTKRNDLVVIVAGWTGRDKDLRDWQTQAERDPRLRLDCRHLDDETFARYLRAADAMLVLAHEHFSSGAAVSGVSAGRAILGGPSDHVHFLCGTSGHVLLDVASPSALARSLDQLNRSALLEAGTHNASVAETLSWEKSAQVLLAAYGLNEAEPG